VNVTSNGAYIYSFSGFEQYGSSFGANDTDPMPWAYPPDASRVRFLHSMAGTNGVAIRYVITGFYESV
jgi:hypothetical protein